MPIYIGAVGPRMLELAGEIADGVHLDFLLPTSYLVDAKAAIAKGEAQARPGAGAGAPTSPRSFHAALTTTTHKRRSTPVSRSSRCT